MNPILYLISKLQSILIFLPWSPSRHRLRRCLRLLLLAAYWSIRLSRRSSAPSIWRLAGDQVSSEIRAPLFPRSCRKSARKARRSKAGRR